MVNHAQDFVAVKKYEILQFSLIPSMYVLVFFDGSLMETTCLNAFKRFIDIIVIAAFQMY